MAHATARAGLVAAYGASRARTGDLLGAIQALSQLSYSPAGGQSSVAFRRTLRRQATRSRPHFATFAAPLYSVTNAPTSVGGVSPDERGYDDATREEEDALPGLMNRASTVVKARISKLLDRAEDPSITLDYSYEKQRELLQNVKRGVADVVTAKKRLELQSQKLEQEIEKLETQARQALSAGREDLARSALERKALVRQQLQSLDQQGTALEAQQEKLIEAEKRLSAKVEAFRTQKETIKATYSAAEAQVKIGEAATGIGEEMADTGLAIERARDKTEQMQARAAAVDELTEAGTLEDFTEQGSSLDRELAQISAGSQVDDELARMKGELGSGETKKEIEQ
jgi:phage shock protein A